LIRGRLIALVIVAVLSAPAAARADLLDGSYRFGYSLGSARAFLPPTAQGRMIGSITYHEFGGVVGKTIILMGLAPREPAPHVRIVDSSTWCGVSHCYTTTRYEVTQPSEAEWAQYEQDKQEFARIAPEVIEKGVPLDIFIDLAGPGGDATGASFTLLFRGQFAGLFGFPAGWIQGGFGFGGYTFADLERKEVVLEGGTLVNRSVTDSYRYRYAGFPFRLTVFPYRHFGAYLQFDLNLYALPLFDDEDRRPSLTRVGAEMRLRPLYLRAEAAASAFDPDSISVFGEVGLEL